MIVPPGFSRPARSASSIIFTAMRSLIELPGLKVSSLTRTVPGTSRAIRLIRTIGVWPMVSRMVLAIFVIVDFGLQIADWGLRSGSEAANPCKSAINPHPQSTSAI